MRLYLLFTFLSIVLCSLHDDKVRVDLDPVVGEVAVKEGRWVAIKYDDTNFERLSESVAVALQEGDKVPFYFTRSKGIATAVRSPDDEHIYWLYISKPEHDLLKGKPYVAVSLTYAADQKQSFEFKDKMFYIEIDEAVYRLGVEAKNSHIVWRKASAPLYTWNVVEFTDKPRYIDFNTRESSESSIFAHKKGKRFHRAQLVDRKKLMHHHGKSAWRFTRVFSICIVPLLCIFIFYFKAELLELAAKLKGMVMK